MAIGTLTMILANVGLSIFNNWAGSRQNKQIADKREEFERAARDGQRERMLRLMREGQELTFQMEEEKHQERLQELNDQFDNLIKEMTYSAVIDHWPLKTLPIVMKNQALGNLLAKQEEKVALHCILTPSNCYDFNQYVLPKVESALEEYCNLHWSNLSGYPILFYSGAWNGNDAPTGTQVASLQTALSNLPSLLITPYFRPTDGKLVFQVYTWGIGSNHHDMFSIPVIEPTEFQNDYINTLNWPAEENLIEEAVEDLVPYLQCMIGYIADSYFWSAFGSMPQLPHMLTDGTINTDGMKYLVDDTHKNYEDLYVRSENVLALQPFSDTDLLSFLSGVSPLWSNDVKVRNLERLFVSHFSITKGHDFSDMNAVLCSDSFCLSDSVFLKQFYDLYFKCYGSINLRRIDELIQILNAIDCDYSLFDSTDVVLLEKLSETSDIAKYRLGEMYEFSIGVKHNKKRSDYYYSTINGDNDVFIKILKSHYFSNENPTSEISIHGMVVPVETILKYLSQSGVVQASLLLAQRKSADTHTNYIEPIQILEGIEKEHPYKYYLLASIPTYNDYEDMLRKSADMGFITAQEKLCALYKEGNCHFSENPSLHVHYAELGMLQNSPYCTYAMAMCYLDGYGVTQSTNTAIMLLHRAGDELGYLEAQRIVKLLNSI